MTDDFGLDSFINDIASRDDLLKTAKGNVALSSESKKDLPVRGAPRVVDVTPTPAPPKAKAKAAKAPPAAPKASPAADDDAAIWDEDEVASLPAAKPPPAAAAAKAAPSTKPAAASKSEEVKPRQRKHAYEYFNQWDRYDVDAEVAKLEDAKAKAEEEEDAVPSRNDGLPPDLTAAALEKMAPIEIERRALNEKTKGNEAYKAGEFKEAVKAYTHSLRLMQDNAVVYANRGMCHLKLKQYRQTLADCTAAIQIDDSYTKAYLRRGIAHRRLSQTAQAISDLDIVLHREPHNKEAQEHRRCAQIEKETAERERRALAESNAKTLPGKTASGKKSSVVIEEVSDDSDDEEGGGAAGGGGGSKAGLAETPEMRKLRLEMEAQSERERARAEEAERRGRERPGPMVDPQAMQESDELLGALTKMNQGSSWGQENASKPQPPKKAEEDKKKKVVIEEEEDDDDDDEPTDGFAPSKKFTGARTGWVFKTGPNGLGYYKEAPPPKPAGMRKLAVEEDSEDDSEEEEVPIKVKKAEPAKPPAAKPPAAGMKKMAIVEDDSDSDDEEEVPIKVK
jgi:tetratricopeptide (TPR) repeat protein